jgi:hypothetical protein
VGEITKQLAERAYLETEKASNQPKSPWGVTGTLWEIAGLDAHSSIELLG